MFYELFFSMKSYHIGVLYFMFPFHLCYYNKLKTDIAFK